MKHIPEIPIPEDFPKKYKQVLKAYNATRYNRYCIEALALEFGYERSTIYRIKRLALKK